MIDTLQSNISEIRHQLLHIYKLNKNKKRNIQKNISYYRRRDSQLSVIGSREWYGSEDRLSATSGSIGGHRGFNNSSEALEETTNGKPLHNSRECSQL